MKLFSPFRTLLIAAALAACSAQASAAVISLDFSGNVVDTSAGFPVLGTPVNWTVRYDTSMTEVSRNSVGPTKFTSYSTNLPAGFPAAVIHLPGSDVVAGLDLFLFLTDNVPGSIFVDNFHGFSSWSGGQLQYQLVYGNDMWENFFGSLPAIGAALPASLPPPPLFTISLLDQGATRALLHIEGRAQPQVVDAPATLALLGIGALAGFVARRRRRST